jgi:phosphinothricin acetyltransferase
VTVPHIRPATDDDVPALNAIYNAYIVDSHVSFDTEPWTDDQRLAWLEQRVAEGYPVIVAEVEGSVMGAAWSGPWRDKAAYRGSVETTIVLAPDAGGAGVGTALMSSLLGSLAAGGFHAAIAVIALPNDASIGLHRKMGYRVVGVLDEVGHKDGAFHDTMIMERLLSRAP